MPTKYIISALLLHQVNPQPRITIKRSPKMYPEDWKKIRKELSNQTENENKDILINVSRK